MLAAPLCTRHHLAVQVALGSAKKVHIHTRIHRYIQGIHRYTQVYVCMDACPPALFVAANILAFRLIKPRTEASSGEVERGADSLEDVVLEHNNSFLVNLDSSNKGLNQQFPIEDSTGLTRVESSNSIHSDYSLGLSKSASLANNINELGNLCIGVKFNTLVNIFFYTGYAAIGFVSIWSLYYLQHRRSNK